MRPSREQLIQVPGGQVWTATYGKEAGPTLLVLHGGPGMPSYYLECLAELADQYEVVLYDQLGCGRSDRPDDPSLWTVSRAVTELQAVRRELDLEEVTLLGHSWGGYLALTYAATETAGLSGLILSSPLVSVERWMQDASVRMGQLSRDVAAAIARHEADGTFDEPEYLDATIDFYRRFFCSLDPWPASLQRTFKEMGEQPYQVMWGPSEFTQTGNLRGHDLSDLLSQLSVPSLWICGTQDEVLAETLTDFAELARGRVRTFEGGTHCLHLEHTEQYLNVVRDFLADPRGQSTK
jgi:proline iminopeptidase